MGAVRHGHVIGEYNGVARRSSTYSGWQGMKDRCGNPNNSDYHLYGGRGVKVCERWLTFADFLADMGERPAGMQLDRIDNTKGYEPGNCRWVTVKQNMRNRRNCRFYTAHGETLCMEAWAERYNMHPETLKRRLLKMPIEEALSKPLGRWA